MLVLQDLLRMIRVKKGFYAAVVFGAVVASSPLLAQSNSEPDPWEGFNRTMFSFNEGLDRYALKPVTLGYKAVTPDLVETGVSNFFDNLSDFGTLLNNLLQGKFEPAGQDFARITFNSTFGLAGVLDVATPMGIPQHDEDFGQTLGYWGMGSGPYVVLPFFGPSSVRDTAGLAVDISTSPVRRLEDDSARYLLMALEVVDTRSRLLDAEKLITGDKYNFLRDAYLQRREFLIKDGVVDNYSDENF